MSKFTIAALTALLLLSIALVGGLRAQETTEPGPEATAEPVDCDPAALMVTQAELSRQLRDFASEVESDSAEALATLYEVGQAYQEIALACGHIPDDVEGLVINTEDLDRIMTVLADLNGDPLHGQLLYNGEEATADGVMLGCAGCHTAGEVAPPTEGTWTRWDEVRSQLPQFEDYTFEQYTVESIIHPWDYFVPTWPEYTMPDFYETQLSYQDLADIVAYLSSQDQLVETGE